MERRRGNLPRAMMLGALALFAGLAITGVPLGSLLVLGLVLTCPLMMAGMHMGSGHADRLQRSDDAHHDEHTAGPSRPDLREPHHAGLE